VIESPTPNQYAASTLEAKVESKDTLRIFDGNTESTLHRLSEEVNATALVGSWASTFTSEGQDEQFLVVRRADGTGFSLERYIHHEHKAYEVDAYAFTWKVFGRLLIETYQDSEAGGESYDVLFRLTKVDSDTVTSKVIDEFADESEEELEPITDHRTTASDLPPAPEGYTLMGIDECWELVNDQYSSRSPAQGGYGYRYGTLSWSRERSAAQTLGSGTSKTVALPDGKIGIRSPDLLLFSLPRFPDTDQDD
jgi:hypothetical protein